MKTEQENQKLTHGILKLINPQFLSSILILLVLIIILGFEKKTNLYTFSISESEVIDSVMFNNKKVKVDMVSESSITPNKIEFKNSNLKEILKSIFVMPEKYIITDNTKLYDFSLILNQNNLNTDTIRRIFISNIFESLHLQINIISEQKEVYNLDIIDSIKFKEIRMKPSSRRTSIKKIAYQLDYKYNGIFIIGNDTMTIASIDLRGDMSFLMLQQKFRNDYGLGFSRINQELKFVKVE